MVKTNIKPLIQDQKTTNSAIEFVQWPSSFFLTEKVVAIQTTRFPVEQHLNTEKKDNSSYQAFNLGLHVGDNAKKVESNRRSLQTLLPKNTPIQWLEQVHGDHVTEIDQVSDHAIVADAAVTRKKNVCLAIMTADCLPILLISKTGDEIAAIHGGWRSLASGIIKNTINKMDTNAAELYAWLGPCIGQSAFEVGGEVKDAFVNLDNTFDSAFIAQKTTKKITQKKGKYLADLQKIAMLQLQQLGVININALTDCTFSNTDKYYSHRKSSQSNSSTGRMVSLICLK